MSDDLGDFFALPPFKPDEALVQMRRQLKDMKLQEQPGSAPLRFALKGVVVAELQVATLPELARALALLMGDNDVALAYAKRLGNVPARLDAAQHPKFAELGAMTADHALLPQARALRSTVGANAMMAGVARATEAVLIGKVDGAGAQQLLLQYVSHVLGEDTVGKNREAEINHSALAQANSTTTSQEAQ